MRREKWVLALVFALFGLSACYTSHHYTANAKDMDGVFFGPLQGRSVEGGNLQPRFQEELWPRDYLLFATTPWEEEQVNWAGQRLAQEKKKNTWVQNIAIQTQFSWKDCLSQIVFGFIPFLSVTEPLLLNLRTVSVEGEPIQGGIAMAREPEPMVVAKVETPKRVEEKPVEVPKVEVKPEPTPPPPVPVPVPVPVPTPEPVLPAPTPAKPLEFPDAKPLPKGDLPLKEKIFLVKATDEKIRDFPVVLSRVGPSVVQVETAQGKGSGVVLTRDGYILTNTKFLSGSASVSVRVGNDKVYPAQVVARKESADAVLLKIEAGGLTPIPVRATIPKVGEEVAFLGAPFGLSGSIARGNIGAAYQNGQNLLLQTDILQTAAGSGGPVIDSNGNLIGISSAKLGPKSGKGCAIAFESIKQALGME